MCISLPSSRSSLCNSQRDSCRYSVLCRLHAVGRAIWVICVRVAQQQTHRSFLPVELVHDELAARLRSSAGSFNDGAAQYRFTAHEERDADEAVLAGHRDLGGVAFGGQMHQRDERGRREIDVPHDLPGLPPHLARRHVDPFESRRPALQHFGRQCGQKAIRSEAPPTRSVAEHGKSLRATAFARTLAF
jgi:hypothetical protein